MATLPELGWSVGMDTHPKSRHANAIAANEKTGRQSEAERVKVCDPLSDRAVSVVPQCTEEPLQIDALPMVTVPGPTRCRAGPWAMYLAHTMEARGHTFVGGERWHAAGGGNGATLGRGQARLNRNRQVRCGSVSSLHESCKPGERLALDLGAIGR